MEFGLPLRHACPQARIQSLNLGQLHTLQAWRACRRSHAFVWGMSLCCHHLRPVTCPVIRAPSRQVVAASGRPETISAAAAGPSRSSLVRTGLAASMTTLGLQLAPEAVGADSAFPIQPQRQGQVALRTLKDSELVISFFPRFAYDARGGGGLSDGQLSPNGTTAVEFDLATLNIPDVSYKTAKFLGVPIVPGVNIAIVPSKLEGWINRSTGEAQLQFNAQFDFTAGSLYKAKPLMVDTLLTTESVRGEKHSRDRTGVRMDSNGFAKLVGVSNVPKSGDTLMDNFLRLPTDALALMSCQFMFT